MTAKGSAGTAKSAAPASDEQIEQKKQRARKILSILKKCYPGATTALHHSNALELLIATILSAQCTDERVNEVTKVLFSRYKSAADYANAPRSELEKLIKSTGYYRQKAKNIHAACKVIAERFDGRVPDSMEDLLQLPGVARKTANVVLGTAYGKNEGIVVDTHVGRLAWRLGLTWSARNEKDSAKIEQDLMQLFPRKDWTFAGHAMIWHGRLVCKARKPDCQNCKLSPHCPSAGTAEQSAKGKRAAKAR